MQQVHNAGGDIEDARVHAVVGPQVLDVRHADALRGHLVCAAPARSGQYGLNLCAGEPVLTALDTYETMRSAFILCTA